MSQYWVFGLRCQQNGAGGEGGGEEVEEEVEQEQEEGVDLVGRGGGVFGAYGCDELFDKCCQTLVDEIGDDSNRLRLAGLEGLGDIAGHILLKHGLDVSALSAIIGKYRLAAQQAAFLCRVPMEFNCVCRLALCNGFGGEEHAHRFQDRHGTTSVVVGARGGEERGEEEVDAILVCADHNCLVRQARDGGDDAGLAPLVFKKPNCSSVFARAGGVNGGVDLTAEPFRRGDSGGGFVVARMEGCEGLQLFPHVMRGKGFGERFDGRVVGRFRWEGSRFGFESESGIGFAAGCYIHKVVTLLRRCCQPQSGALIRRSILF
jgi:hypothetical protein